MTAPGTIIATRYRVIRELGRGGMGAVYLVEHVNTGDRLALKVLLQHMGARTDMVERFKREARAPARIRSVHVVKVVDADVAPELEGAPFLVMEALDGCDLERRLAATGPIPPAELVAVLAAVASALDKAHAMGIVHRDLKPENVFLHRDDAGSTVVKVLDFGISKMLGDSEGSLEHAGLTKAGSMMGTPLYMSPEQVRGDLTSVGPAADIWAIGLIAFKLLTGKNYWWAQTMTSLLLQIVNDPFVPPSVRDSTLPPAFDLWFARSCARDPMARWASVGEQVGALAIALGVSVAPEAERSGDYGPVPAGALGSSGTPASSVALSAGPVSRSETQGPVRGSSLLIGSMVLAVLAIVTITLSFIVTRRPQPRPAPASDQSQEAPKPATPPPIVPSAIAAAPSPAISASVGPPSSAPSEERIHPAVPSSTPRRKPAPFQPSAP